MLDNIVHRMIVDQHAKEVSGEINIVLSGQGEADFNSKATPEETASRLRRIAEDCGYLVGSLKQSPCSISSSLDVWCNSRHFRIHWHRRNATDCGLLSVSEIIDDRGFPVWTPWQPTLNWRPMLMS